MKRLVFLFVLAFASFAQADPITLARMAPAIGVMGGGAAAPAGCTTVHAQNSSAHASLLAHNQASGNDYYVGQWDYNPGANISVCKVDIILTAYGSISADTYYIDIYATDTSGTPKALTTLQGSSDGVTGNNSWSSATVSFAFSTPVAISNGTNYAIVLRTSRGSGSDTNRVSVSASNSGGLGGFNGRWNSSKAGTGWGADDVRLTIYK